MPKYTNRPLLPEIEAVLKESNSPLHYKEITNRLIEQGVWETLPATPSNTISHFLSTSIKKQGLNSPFVRTAPGVYVHTDVQEVRLATAIAERNRVASVLLGTGQAARAKTTKTGFFSRLFKRNS